MRYNSTCGLGPGEVAELTARIFQVLTGRGDLPRWKVPLGRQVEIVLVMLRQNLPQQLVADLCGVSQPTISRIFRRIVPLLEQVTCLHGADLSTQTAGRVVLVDGTYVPAGNRAATGRTNYSGKHHVQCLNVQVAATLGGHLLAVSEPVSGARHDAGALHVTGWDHVLDDVEWIGDAGYTGHAPTVTRMKRPGADRSDHDKEWNRSVASLRAPVERVIGHFKCWKIVAKGWRGRLRELPRIIRLITLLERYRTGW